MNDEVIFLLLLKNQKVLPIYNLCFFNRDLNPLTTVDILVNKNWCTSAETHVGYIQE